MRSLGELMASEDGLTLLETRGIVTSEESFVGSLLHPSDGRLAQHVGVAASQPLVYAAHQLMADYPESVSAKLRTTRQIAERPDVSAVLLWLDMDRAGADRMAGGSVVRGPGGLLQMRFAARRHDDKEVRFVPVDRAYLNDTVRKMEAWARQNGAAGGRLVQIAGRLREVSPGTLGEANMALTSFLLRNHLEMRAPSVPISDLAGRGFLTGTIDEVVNAVEDVVTVFNAAIDSLLAADVDPQVHHLQADYLPLRYSCDRDDRRCTLARERSGVDTFAVARCACGALYRFHLGSDSLSIGELAATGRWSTDVTLPVYLNDLASGIVAGRSSAIYGMVLNQVLEKVLGRRPIPMLLPTELSAVLATGGEKESLLQRYVSGP
jgi:hypothetical protein